MGLSHFFAAKLKFILPQTTKSLATNLQGFRNYPIEVIFEKEVSHESLWLQFEVLYSSTCPQSASLSMEVLKSQKQIIERLPATPHAQRSRARVIVQLQEFNQSIIEELIEQVETSLGTPVQTTVKKADEMKFAELNAANLMFCEDAARKISDGFKQNSNLLGWSIYCEHQESLHPHNASSMSLTRFKSPSRLQFG
jgi:GTP cyclohydrolase I